MLQSEQGQGEHAASSSALPLPPPARAALQSFRSILPHEPIPLASDEPRGYLQMQGAFSPKPIKTVVETKTELSSSKDDTILRRESETPRPPQASSSFWSREVLELALMQVLSLPERTMSTQGSVDSSGTATVLLPSLDLPFVAEAVHVLDPSPPFTKVRATYPSPRAAQLVLLTMRRLQISPAMLFAQLIPPFNPLCNNDRDTNHKNGNVSFGVKPLQLTQVTMRPLPPLDQCWNRSSPPKFRRLLPTLVNNDVAQLEQDRGNARFVFMTNLLGADVTTSAIPDFWYDPHCVAQAIRSVVNSYDDTNLGVEVFVAHHQRPTSRSQQPSRLITSCHVGMRCPAQVQTMMQGLQDRQVLWTWTDAAGRQHHVTSGNLFLDYAAVTDRSIRTALVRINTNKSTGLYSHDPYKGDEQGDMQPVKGTPPRSECTSLTQHVDIPGLVLIPDFVSIEAEAALVAVLHGPQAPWAPPQSTQTHAGRHVKRNVQHYGYVFDYQTADVLRDRHRPGADCPPMPALDDSGSKTDDLELYMEQRVKEGRGWEVLAALIERTRRFLFHDQSNPECAVSYPTLNQLTVNFYAPGEGIGSHVDTPAAFGDGLISISLNSGIVMEFRKVHRNTEKPVQQHCKKLVYLPARSMLLMSRDARYEWEHMIVSRMTDTHNGIVLPRSLRVSLTLRTALATDGTCMPLVASGQLPPIWGLSSSIPIGPLATPACERDHVHAVYDAIAMQWHHTRGRRGVLWPGATQFLQRLPPGSVVADVGCGDGKYFPAIWEAGSYVIGTDISRPLLLTSMSTRHVATSDVPEPCRVGDNRIHLRDRPAVAVADCMRLPLRDHGCDAAICIAVMHHISTLARRIQCVKELVRIVKPGGLINIQAWAMEQEDGSRHRFAATDVYVPFNAQPKYLEFNRTDNHTNHRDPNRRIDQKSTAQGYSEVHNAEYDDAKGLVVFKRYCHVYRQGELEEIVSHVVGVTIVDTGFESGNHFVILQVVE